MMKNEILVLLAAALFLASAEFCCAQQVQPLSIDAGTLGSMLNKPDQIVLVDGRSFLECMDTRLPGSFCASGNQEKDEAVFARRDKNTKIVFYTGRGTIDYDHPLYAAAVKKGFSNIYGLEGGLLSWREAGNPVEFSMRIPRIPAQAVKPENLSAWLKKTKNSLVVDIRPAREYSAGHLEGALNFPLALLHIRYPDIPLEKTLLVTDEDGTESFLASSYLYRKGFIKIFRLKGGMAEYRRGVK